LDTNGERNNNSGGGGGSLNVNDDHGDDSDEIEYGFYDEDGEAGDGGFESDVDGDGEEPDFDSDYVSDLDNNFDDDSEAGEPGSYIVIGIGFNDYSDSQLKTDTDGDIVVNDATDGGNSGNGNGGTGANANIETNKNDEASRPKTRAFDLQGAMVTVANALAESKERLINVLTHPAIHPFPYQYRLGKNKLIPDIFKSAPKIDLKKPDEAGNCATTYLGVGRHEDSKYYMYIGSATGTNPTAGAMTGAKEELEEKGGAAKEEEAAEENADAEAEAGPEAEEARGDGRRGDIWRGYKVGGVRRRRDGRIDRSRGGRGRGDGNRRWVVTN
jgi:hypothetical protein